MHSLSEKETHLRTAVLLYAYRKLVPRCILGLGIMLTLLVTASCARQTNEINATLGKEFQLAIGQSASIAGENLKIRFIEIVSDSRCPQGAVCIWAGEAKCRIEIEYSGVVYREVFTEPGLSPPPRTDFQKYEITFNLLPYPQVGKETQGGDYRLSLVFNKKPALTSLKLDF